MEKEKKKKKARVVLRSLTSDGQVIVEINGKVYEFWMDAALSWKIKWMFDRGRELQGFVLLKKIAWADKRREDLEDQGGKG